MEKLASIRLDLNGYKITLQFSGGTSPLVVHFDTPSRRFYFSMIVLIVTEMKKRGRQGYFHVHRYKDILSRLDKSLSGKNASKHEDGLLAKIRMAWLHRLPDLESAVLFKVLGRDLISPYEKGGKYRYQCSEAESDAWASLFGCDENNKWRFKFPSDSSPIDVDDISVIFGNLRDQQAWDAFFQQLDVRNKSTETFLKHTPVAPEKPSTTKIANKAGVRKTIWVSAAVLGTLIIAVFLWRASLSETKKPVDKVDLGYAVYPDASKPSIAVLPFENISGDADQQYFCDGMTEQLITALSQGPYLYVTSRTSSYAFKDTKLTAQQIAEELGVGYLLEGSVQRDADRVRINVQLIDGRSGNHIWAEHYDRKYEDLFAIEDEITMSILAELNIEVTGFIAANLKNVRPSNLQAYEHFLKGLYYHLGRRPEDIEKARAAFQDAIDLDPNFAKAYMFLGLVDMDEITVGGTKTPEKYFEKAEEMAKKAMELDPDNPPYALWSYIYREKGNFEKAIYYGKKCVEQDPNGPYRYYFLANAQRFAGEYADAVVSAETALKLIPFRPINYLNTLGWSYLHNRQFSESIPVFEEVIDKGEKSLYGFFAYLGLAAAYELKGNHDKAVWAVENVMKRNPKFSLARLRARYPTKDTPEKELEYDAWRKAGLK